MAAYVVMIRERMKDAEAFAAYGQLARAAADFGVGDGTDGAFRHARHQHLLRMSPRRMVEQRGDEERMFLHQAEHAAFSHVTPSTPNRRIDR